MTTTGEYITYQRVRSTAEPIDNIVKFAWNDDDYETVTEWHDYTEEELAEQKETFKREIRETIERNTIKILDAIVEMLAESIGDAARPLLAERDEILGDIDDEIALEMTEVFPVWRSGMDVEAGKRYRYGDDLYRCVQSHISQDGWTPDAVPALWARVSLDEFPEWVQPTGAQDAYNAGDCVTYNGEHYRCLMDGCVWSPEDYPSAWEKID